MRDIRSPEKNDHPKALLVGVGFDQQDEHVRLTKGKNFQLLGGSDETHGRMLETAIKLNEKLKERGKELADVERQEFDDLMHESMTG